MSNQPYTLVSRAHKSEDTLVRCGDTVIGGNRVIVIAGPCAVESEAQVLETARSVRAAGAHMLRGGAYKPRSSPYSFQGLEKEGLVLLARAREETGLPVVTEVLDPRDADLVAACADMLQIGARNMYNYPLLRSAANAGRPILLKRSPMATIEEWLLAAEYILAEGNPNVVLCERGIRTFEPFTRNTLDLSAVPAVKRLSHLPVVVDPSHGTGRWRLVPPLAKAAIAVGADGLMIEVHPAPDDALSDGGQSLRCDVFARLMAELEALAACLGREC